MKPANTSVTLTEIRQIEVFAGCKVFLSSVNCYYFVRCDYHCHIRTKGKQTLEKRSYYHLFAKHNISCFLNDGVEFCRRLRRFRRKASTSQVLNAYQILHILNVCSNLHCQGPSNPCILQQLKLPPPQHSDRPCKSHWWVACLPFE